MAIPIQNTDDFRRLLTTLSDELVDANIHWRLCSDLSTATETFSEEFNQSRTFWGLTMSAHSDAALFRLCKIYDQHRDGLNLKSFLETVQANLHVFAEQNFRERLKGNPFVDALAADAQTPAAQQLAADLAYVSKDGNPLVETLVSLRNKLYAHRASREVINATDFAAEYPLTRADAEQLLRRGMAIMNAYGQLFHAQSYSTQIVGHDDFRTVLGAVRADLARREEAIRQTERRFGLNNADDGA